MFNMSIETSSTRSSDLVNCLVGTKKAGSTIIQSHGGIHSTFSKSPSDNSLTGSADENAR